MLTQDSEVVSGSESSDEGFGGEVDSDLEDERMEMELRKRSEEDLEDSSGYDAKAETLNAIETK